MCAGVTAGSPLTLGVTLEMPIVASATSADVAALARGVEDAGFYALAYTDRPAPSAKWLASGGHPTFDPVAALAFCGERVIDEAR